MLCSVSRSSWWSGRLAPSTARPKGTPRPSTNWLRLTPFLARSVGVLPVFFPPEGRLGHAPVHRQPGPVDALHVVVVQQPRLPELEEDAVGDPLLEAVVGGGGGAELGGVQRLPLAAGAQDVEDGVGADPVGGARAAAAEAVGVDVLGDAQLHQLPQFIGDAPILGDDGRIHDEASYTKGEVAAGVIDP